MSIAHPLPAASHRRSTPDLEAETHKTADVGPRDIDPCQRVFLAPARARPQKSIDRELLVGVHLGVQRLGEVFLLQLEANRLAVVLELHEGIFGASGRRGTSRHVSVSALSTSSHTGCERSRQTRSVRVLISSSDDTCQRMSWGRRTSKLHPDRVEVATSSDAGRKVDEAHTQLGLYHRGALGEFELSTRRYVVVVADQELELPDDHDDRGTLCHHVLINRGGETPSVSGRRRGSLRTPRNRTVGRSRRRPSPSESSDSLARIVLIQGPMYKNKRSWSPNASAWARVFVKSTTPATTEGAELARAPLEAAPVGSADSRSTESHWEAVIDRATD